MEVPRNLRTTAAVEGKVSWVTTCFCPLPSKEKNDENSFAFTPLALNYFLSVLCRLRGRAAFVLTSRRCQCGVAGPNKSSVRQLDGRFSQVGVTVGPARFMGKKQGNNIFPRRGPVCVLARGDLGVS